MCLRSRTHNVHPKVMFCYTLFVLVVYVLVLMLSILGAIFKEGFEIFAFFLIWWSLVFIFSIIGTTLLVFITIIIKNAKLSLNNKSWTRAIGMSGTSVFFGAAGLITSWWMYGTIASSVIIVVLIGLSYRIYNRDFEYTLINTLSKANNNNNSSSSGSSNNNNNIDKDDSSESSTDTIDSTSSLIKGGNSENVPKNYQSV